MFSQLVKIILAINIFHLILKEYLWNERMMSIQVRLQGGLQGRIDTRIYQRKKIGPRSEVQKIGPKPEGE